MDDIGQRMQALRDLIEEQQPDTSLPCPHCGRPVGDTNNIRVRGFERILIVSCGGSGFDYTRQGCFNEVAWNPATRKWMAWDATAGRWAE